MSLLCISLQSKLSEKEIYKIKEQYLITEEYCRWLPKLNSRDDILNYYVFIIKEKKKKNCLKKKPKSTSLYVNFSF